MKVTVKDNRYFPIKDLKIGSIAIGFPTNKENGKIIQRIFAKVYIPNPTHNQQCIIELTDLSNQYLDHINPETLVRLLEKGESIIFHNE